MAAGLRRRRLAFLAGVAALAGGLVALAVPVLAPDGWTLAEALILLCLAVNAPWLALSGATGLVGLALRLGCRDPAAALVPALRGLAGDAPVSARTVIAVCVRLEEIGGVLAPCGALLAALEARAPGRFALAILSDTPPGCAAAEEAAAVARLAARAAPGQVIYRRRAGNSGFKAGNLMDFLDGPAAAPFDFALVPDADSVMSAATVLRLVRVMQADPALGVLQPTVAGRGAETGFAQVFGFGHRSGARIWATGQAWWQGPAGPYRGHNALPRIAAFRKHARLPLLPDGRHILSHDHVEAALLHGAGWAVRVLPEDAGSAERHPPDLPALFARDARWAAGNLQYRHLLRHAALGRIGRLQMLQAMLHYLLAPLWFALLPLAAVNAATGGGAETPRGWLLALLGCGTALLHLPKLAGHAELLLRGGVALRRVGQELAFGLLLDPVAALDRTLTLLRLASRADEGWAPQARRARGWSWAACLRRFGLHTGVGVVLAALFAAAGPFALAASVPALAGLLGAVPLAALTARPSPPPSRARPPPVTPRSEPAAPPP